jgi:lipopolysaccharide transport system ATP-binding protein
MGDVTREGRTVLFVSHNMSAINTLCKYAILLKDGQIAFRGEASETVRHYLEDLGGEDQVCTKAGSASFPVDPQKPIQIREVSLTDREGNARDSFDYQENAFVNVRFDIRAQNKGYLASLMLRDVMGNVVFFSSDDDLDEPAVGKLDCGQYSYRVKFPRRLLKPGKYYLTVSLNERGKVGSPIDRTSALPAIEITDLTTRRGVRKGFRQVAIVAPEIEWKLALDANLNRQDKR